MARSGGAGRVGAARDVVLLAIVAAGAVLRGWGLGAQSLWYDEWLTVEATSGGVGDLLRHVANREGIPPPYFLLMWGWVRVFGEGEVALRSVSALAGVATIPVVYAVVRELGLPRRTARVAALLVAVNPMLVWYSQEVRPYSLLALLGAVSLLTFARVWRRGGRRDWTAWSLVCAGAVAVHYFAVFLVLAEALALALAVGRGRGGRPSTPAQIWRRVGLSLVPSAIVLAALAPVAVRQHSHEANRLWISGFPLTDRLAEAGRSALVGPSPPGDRLWIVVVIGVVGAGALLAVPGRREHRAVAGLVAGIGGVGVVLPLLAAAVSVDVVLSRYLIATLVPLLVAVAVGLTADAPTTEAGGASAEDRARGPTTLVSLAGLGAVGVVSAVSLVAVVAVVRDPELQRAEWRQVAEAVGRGHGQGVLVLNVHGTLASPLRHYLPDSRALRDGETVGAETIDVLVAKPTDRPCNLLVGRGCGMVFLGAPPPDPLARRLRLVERIDLDQFRVDRYRADAPLMVTREDLVNPPDRAGALILVL